MRIKLSQTQPLLSAFNYSSLTDIVMLLLIFFLLTSSFIATKGLKVNLPEAVNAKVADAKQITISLSRDGAIYINDRKTGPKDFSAELKKLLTAPDKQVIILSSDKDVPLSRAVFVMDEAKGIGASRFFISTTTAKEKSNDGQQR